MTVQENGKLMTKKHEKLLDIALLLKVTAWVILAGSIVLCITTSFQLKNQMILENGISSARYAFSYYLTSNPLLMIHYYVSLMIVITKGFVVFLILFGVSLGLKMIVETDMNYRIKGAEVILG